MLKTIKSITLIKHYDMPYMKVEMESEICLQPLTDSYKIYKTIQFLRDITGLDYQIHFDSFEQFNSLFKDVTKLVTGSTYEIEYKDNLISCLFFNLFYQDI